MNHCRQSTCRSLASVTIPLFILALFLAGCIDLEPRPDPTRIFVLTGNAPIVPSTNKRGIALRVNRIELPSYLDSPKMAIRQGGLEIVYSDFNRWGEDLDTAIARNLVNSLLTNPHVSRVVLAPSNQAPSDYYVTVTILRFEGENSNAAVLEARWDIFDSGTMEISESGNTSARRPWDGTDYAALARALSDTLTVLGQDISRALDEVSSQP